MTPLAWISLATVFTTCTGTSVYLFARGRIPDDSHGGTPWVFLVTRLTLLTAAAFSLLVMNTVRVFALALGFFFVSVVLEWRRRQRSSADTRRAHAADS